MATGFEGFDRQITLATAGLEPAAINSMLAKFARQELGKAIAAGASKQYDKFVNGREGAPEESVRAPGPIVYEFVNWPLIINAALAELQKRGPRAKSGLFSRSYVVIVGGRVAVTDFSKIRPDAEVIILNTAPYTRKAEVGKLGIAAQRLFKGTSRVMNTRFKGAFTFESKFVNVPAGINPRAPYTIKRGKLAGQHLTYPAILINAVA